MMALVVSGTGIPRLPGDASPVLAFRRRKMADSRVRSKSSSSSPAGSFSTFRGREDSK